MNSQTHLKPIQDESSWTTNVLAELEALTPKRLHRTAERFAELYPTIEALLARGITQRSILNTLAKHDLKLHPSRFKELLDNARKKTTVAEHPSDLPQMKEGAP